MTEGHSPGLRANALGAADTAMMAVAGSAPAYSIAATTATLVAAAGLASPAALLYCGIPMLGIAWAFSYLGRAEVNAGASYAWVGRALHPALGFLSGWALVVSATLFMVAGSLPAGALTLSLFSPDLAGNTALVTVVGAGWFLVMAIVVLLGAHVTARVQWIMTGVEVAILAGFVVAGFARAPQIAVQSFSWSWLGFGHFDGFGGFAAAALVAAFYYWGWDVSANLNEETKSARRAAGAGGITGVLVVLGLFLAFTVMVNMLLSADTIAADSGNLLDVLGQAIWPGAGGKILSLAVMLSTIATLETTLVQVTRTMFAMGRDRTLPAALGRTHPKWRTPWLATVIVAAVALALFVLSNFLGSVGTILTAAISAIGLQIAFYYGLAGLAVVITYRRELLKSVRNLVFVGLWPLLGAAFLLWIFIQAVLTNDAEVNAIGLGALALGLVPMTIAWVRRSPYFTRHSEPVADPAPVAVPADT
ncbi:APC family permease [Amycolatopsis thermalba]|uniref:APC family permease n=1 Tax=Amycolatopsis thermalba TaxID=944492 RepID=UPI000E25407B|nr:APC family permease [Amycolatopsis thermalba]